MKILKNIIVHLRAIKDGILGLFDKKYHNVPFDRIIFICGISANKYSLAGWNKMLLRLFPDTEIIIMRKYYVYNKTEKVEEFLQEITQELSKKQKTLLIGYSFGGMLAKTAISRLKDIKHILCLVTLATPHKMHNFGIDEAIKNFSIPESVDVTTLTFGGNLDAVVPLKYTEMKNSKAHYTLPCTHLAFDHIRRTRKEVIDIVMHNCSSK